MPEQFLSYWDDTLKKYVEVSTTNPLPTGEIGGGAGGSQEVEITSTNGPAATSPYDQMANTIIGLVTDSRLLAQSATEGVPLQARFTEGDAIATNINSLYTQSHNMGFDGTAWDRLRVQDGSNDGRAVADKGLQVYNRSFAFNGTSWDRVRSTGGALHSSVQTIPVVGSEGNAWNNVAVAADGVSTSIDCQYVKAIDCAGTVSAATTITAQVSQDNVKFYDWQDTGALPGAGDFIFNMGEVGFRYVRLKSSAAATITGTIAGKG
jgi:hypothetical protein